MSIVLNFKVVLVCCICFLFGVTNCQNEEKSSQSYKLELFYYHKCYNQTNDVKAFEKLYNDSSQFMKYLEYTFSLIPEKKEIFCESQRKQLDSRIDEIAKDLEVCQPPNEKYLPEFIKTSFKEFTHFICHKNGQYINRLFSYENKQCRENLENDLSPSLNNCFGRIFKPLSHTLLKKDLCQDMSVAEKCFQLILEEKCPNSASMKELNAKFFKYISKPCSGCISQISTTLLIFSVVLMYLFNKN